MRTSNWPDDGPAVPLSFATTATSTVAGRAPAVVKVPWSVAIQRWYRTRSPCGAETTRCCGVEELNHKIVWCGVGTAYRIPGETSHASQPRTPSTSRRRMRHMRHGP